jgi:lipid-A-disaccharide synthase
MRYYIIAGEASGDLHGSNLVKELIKQSPESSFRGWGGDLMQSAGVTIVKHYRELAFMGFSEVIANLGTILRNIRFCKQDIEAYKPDAIILVDYPGFNLRIAKWAKERGIRTIYYISPQIWAWKEGRINEIKKNVDQMLVILPFEEAYYQNKWGHEVEYVGHPLVSVIELAKEDEQQTPPESGSPLNEKPIVALLPGSRKQEINQKLPLMLEATKNFPAYHFILAKTSSLDDAFYAPFLEQYPKVRALRNRTYELLTHATAALVTSGTATLETALFGVPQVVCYKGSPISYAIAKRVIKVKYISLVNLIMDRPIVKELIQHDLTVENISTELNRILHDKETIQKMSSDYTELKQLLEQKGNASVKAAHSILNYLKISGGKQST